MATKAVVDAVIARLAEQWTDCPVLAGAYRTPGDASPFLAVQFPVAETRRMTVNQRLYREEGAFRIVVATDRDDGEDKPMEWADRLALIFRDRKFGGIETQVPGSITLDDDKEDGVYLRTSFAVPFTRNFTDEG